MAKKIGLYLQIAFYILSGYNHFKHPASYLDMIPPYLPDHHLLNILAGISEIVLGAGLFFLPLRKWVSFLIISMLLAFIPVHVYFIQMNSCIPNVICLPPWSGWVRLFLFHPLLIAWAWWCRK